MHERTVEQQVSLDFGMCHGGPEISSPAQAEGRGQAAAQPDVRMRLHEGALAGKPVRQGNVVRIHAGDQAAARMVETEIQGAGEPQPLAALQQPQSWIAETFENFDRAVVRGVVHHEKFKIAESLVQDAGRRFADMRLPVVHGHQYRDFRNPVHVQASPGR